MNEKKIRPKKGVIAKELEKETKDPFAFLAKPAYRLLFNRIKECGLLCEHFQIHCSWHFLMVLWREAEGSSFKRRRLPDGFRLGPCLSFIFDKNLGGLAFRLTKLEEKNERGR
jgi:hypothetical protein